LLLAEHFGSQRMVILGAVAAGGVREDRATEAWAFRELDVAADARLEYARLVPRHAGALASFQVRLQIAHDFLGELDVRLIQAEQDAGDAQMRIDAPG